MLGPWVSRQEYVKPTPLFASEASPTPGSWVPCATEAVASRWGAAALPWRFFDVLISTECDRGFASAATGGLDFECQDVES